MQRAASHVNELLHLVREVAIVGAELQVEVYHGELRARLHRARGGHNFVKWKAN